MSEIELKPPNYGKRRRSPSKDAGAIERKEQNKREQYVLRKTEDMVYAYLKMTGQINTRDDLDKLFLKNKKIKNMDNEKERISSFRDTVMRYNERKYDSKMEKIRKVRETIK